MNDAIFNGRNNPEFFAPFVNALRESDDTVSEESDEEVEEETKEKKKK